MTVDDYVSSKVLPEHRETVAMLRALVRECAPQAEELVSYRMPVFKARKIFAWISPTKKDITFGFSRGLRFEDKFHLLRGWARARDTSRSRLPTALTGMSCAITSGRRWIWTRPSTWSARGG